MASRDVLLNGLRALGYKFKRETERVEIWRLPGTAKRITISKGSNHDSEYVERVLPKCGMSAADIAQHLAAPPPKRKSRRKKNSASVK